MMRDIAIAVVPPLAAGCAAMAFLWFRQLRTRDATAVDLAWTLLLGVTAA